MGGYVNIPMTHRLDSVLSGSGYRLLEPTTICYFYRSEITIVIIIIINIRKNQGPASVDSGV